MTCGDCDRCREAGYKYCETCGAPLQGCEWCETSRRNGFRYCDHCGRPLEVCERCAEARAMGFRYCDRCGRTLVSQEPPKQIPFLTKLVSLVAVMVIVLLIVELYSMLTGIGAGWNYAADNALGVYVLVPQLEVATVISGLPFQLFWIFLVVAITASLALLFWQSRPELGEEPRKYLERFDRTPLFWLSMLLAADILISAAIGLASAGDVPVTPDTMTGEALVVYANAAVWEEVISRLAYIGIPMAVVALVMGRRDFYRYLLGGFGLSRLAIVLIVISSLLFGFAHMSGWGSWKVLPTFLGGILMGYLYVRFGIHASIAIHFAIDYMGVMVDGPLILVVALMMLGLILAGFPSLMEMARRAWEGRGQLKAMPNLLPEDQESSLSRRE